MNFKRIIVIFFVIFYFLFFIFYISFASSKTIDLYFFYGQNCPYCLKMAQELTKIQERYPQLKINTFEIWHNPQNQRLMNALAETYKVRVGGVPVIFIGEKVIEGAGGGEIFQIREAIRQCSISFCPSPIEKIKIENRKQLDFKKIGLILGGFFIFLILIFSFLKKKK